LGGSRQQKGQNAMRYLSAVCFLAIVAFADASPAAAQQNCACFCRVQGEGGGGCWVDVPGCNPRSGVRACNDGAMCGYSCGAPGLPARRSAPRILSGNIIGQPNSSDSATFRSSSSPELRSCLASRARGQACARFRPGGVGAARACKRRRKARRPAIDHNLADDLLAGLAC